MLSYRDCLDMAAVTEDEGAAIAQHEHIPAIVALELGHNLLASEAGRKRLQEMIVSAVMAAQGHGRCATCERFSRTLGDFIKNWAPEGEAEKPLAPQIAELLAIGLVKDAVEQTPPADPAHAACLEAINEAKAMDDCSACGRLSLQLLRALEIDPR
jgi:hypothetical protein